jgi:hypothetical protein
MIDCGTSFIKMSSVDVEKMANETIALIQNRNIQFQSSIIEQARKKIINGWWHKLWKKSAPDDIEVLFKMSHIDHIVFNSTCTQYNNAKDVCHKLLGLCKIADEIYLSSSDYSLLMLEGIK